MSLYSADDWELELPDGWRAEREDDCDAVYHPDGPGTLELRSFVADQPLDDEDLYEMAADDLDAGATTGDVEHGDFTGFTFRYREDGVYWWQWRLRSGTLALAIGYSCALDAAESQDEDVDDLLDGLRVRD
ncbi:MAG: hypothetical protein KDC48_15770 [Planctomycetes bacterium]|nr:hypothetical protein [Planctomycetota bacterium]